MNKEMNYNPVMTPKILEAIKERLKVFKSI